MAIYLKSYGTGSNGFYVHITPPDSEMEYFMKWLESLEETQSGYIDGEWVTHYFLTNEPCLVEVVVVEPDQN